MDSIINFGENLPAHELQKAFMHAGQVPSQINQSFVNCFIVQP